MYINEYGPQGTFHMGREIIQNCFDECLDTDSQGNKIEIEYDTDTDILKASDNGRGFNEKEFPMNTFCETLQSGSKFFRSAGNASAGEFGVGLTVVNALSEYFKMISYREIEKITHIIEYNDGKLVRDVVKPNKSGLHGTTVEFKVSKKYMGDDAYMPIDDVINWIDKLFYLDSDVLSKRKITCKLLVTNNGATVSTHKFKPQPYVNLLDQILPANIKKKEMSDLTYFKGEKSFIENSKVLVEDKKGNNVVQNVDIEKVLHMDIAFKYCVAIDVSNGATYDTYCNYTNTIENGVHLDAFDEAYCRYMQNKINSTMSDAQRDKLKVTWDDIRTNLFAVINLSTNAQVGFVGNAKRSIGNKDLIPYIKELVTEGLDKFFEEHPSILDNYIKIVKINAKARLEAQRAKTATVKDKINTFSEHRIYCAL